MNYFSKTAYWRPLVPNYESVDKTTNLCLKNTRSPSIAENEAQFVLVYKINMLQYLCVHNNLQKYEEVCE